jgi:hypothetical protein
MTCKVHWEKSPMTGKKAERESLIHLSKKAEIFKFYFSLSQQPENCKAMCRRKWLKLLGLKNSSGDPVSLNPSEMACFWILCSHSYS